MILWYFIADSKNDSTISCSMLYTITEGWPSIAPPVCFPTLLRYSDVGVVKRRPMLVMTSVTATATLAMTLVTAHWLVKSINQGKGTNCGIFLKSNIIRRVATNVTRLGEISPLWQNFKRLWIFLGVYLVFGITLWLIFMLLGTFHC